MSARRYRSETDIADDIRYWPPISYRALGFSAPRTDIIILTPVLICRKPTRSIFLRGSSSRWPARSSAIR